MGGYPEINEARFTTPIGFSIVANKPLILRGFPLIRVFDQIAPYLPLKIMVL